MSDTPPPQQPTSQQPAVNLSAIAQQIGHLTIGSRVFMAQGDEAAALAATRAAMAYADLAMTLLGIPPSE